MFRRLLAIRLLCAVHVQAFRSNPKSYLTAAKWWLLRKRVRARGQFAPLLSQSPKAYELWAMLEERDTAPAGLHDDSTITAMVSAGKDPARLKATLASLTNEGIAVFVIPETAGDRTSGIAHQIDWQKTQWLMPINAGDLLAIGAAATYRNWIGRVGPSCQALYADDDWLDRRGHRKAPYFKPDWNCELHRHHDILTGACIIRANAEILTATADYADWDRKLVAAAIERGSVTHIKAVLHHRASRPSAPVHVEPLQIGHTLPLVSIIIPTRNRADLLRTCIEGLRATEYPQLEIIVADNDSDEPATREYLATLAREGVVVLPQPGPFNYSTINNKAVAIATGELICLMNNDIELLSQDWLAIMATQAMRPEVGAVGAQLLYPDGRIQHAGVVIGVGNAAGHAHRFVRPQAEGYFRRHALPQFVSAVTAACLVVQKQRFLAVGGLDETNFAVAFNDVDLCLRLNRMGWQSFYEPRAVMVHHESVSRGHDVDPVGAARFAGELAALKRIWRTDEIVDPFHHPNLSRASEQFALALLE